ncbi:hypothetical protein HKCCSP123_16090 [Rhodobacterales bacterium HKCCSP123]|nr:hypothetical protein [Rhodobacterales bacterium HKCCSP123]
MPVQFRILSDHGLVYVEYSGHACVQDGIEAFSSYMNHDDRRPGQRHLVDLSGVTGFEQDFPRLFEFQAGKAAAFMTGPDPVMLVYLAPNNTSLKMARLIQRSWEGLDGAVVRVATDWPGAMDILGLPRDALDDVIVRDA